MTYPDPDVHAELEHWVERKVDVIREREVAELFGVTAVPMAVAVTPDGTILKRIPNFVQPEPFRARLAETRDAD